MAKTPKADGSASAAADFADGHVEAVAPAAAALPGYVPGGTLDTALAAHEEAMQRSLQADPAAPLAASAAAPRDATYDREFARIGGEQRRAAADLEAMVPAAEAVLPSPGYILIVCGEPGFRRADLMHPSRAEYPLDFFTGAQLDALLAEPKLQLVAIGGDVVPRVGPAHGEAAPPRAVDPLLAGRAAADAVSRPPNRAEPGLRNRVAQG